MEMTHSTLRSFSNHTHTLAQIALVAGAAGSVTLMLYTGRHNPSILLLTLFFGWVVAPFLVLFLRDRVSKRWPSLAHKSFDILALVLSLASLVTYTGVFNSPTTKPAFIFLVVPLISWVLVVVLMIIVRVFVHAKGNEGAK
jgi:hypothetical protein